MQQSIPNDARMNVECVRIVIVNVNVKVNTVVVKFQRVIVTLNLVCVHCLFSIEDDIPLDKMMSGGRLTQSVYSSLFFGIVRFSLLFNFFFSILAFECDLWSCLTN